MTRLRPVLTLVLSLLVLAQAMHPTWAYSPPAPGGKATILQIRVLEGEGTVNSAGSRSSRPIQVQVTDETGQPVEGASVSFQLPEQGPGGAFASGMRSEVAITSADGKASVWGIVWNRVPGPFQIRITAVKGQVRAGVVVTQHLSDAVAAKTEGGGKQASGAPRSGHSKFWYAVLVITAGAAAGGAAMGLSKYSRQSPPAPAAPAVVTEPPLGVGTPVITIGKP